MDGNYKLVFIIMGEKSKILYRLRCDGESQRIYICTSQKAVSSNLRLKQYR